MKDHKFTSRPKTVGTGRLKDQGEVIMKKFMKCKKSDLISVYLILILIDTIDWIGCQKSPPGAIKNHNQQHQITQAHNSKIDWSNLSARNITNDLPELSTDWLMLGGGNSHPVGRESQVNTNEGNSPTEEFMQANEAKQSASFSTESGGFIGNRNSTLGKRNQAGNSNGKRRTSSQHKSNRTRPSNGSEQQFDDEQSDSSESNEIFDDVEDITIAGTQKEPECASQGRYYCTYKEDYPAKLVTEVTKYYKWPLEKLFRDLHAQIMPKLAQDSNGNLVCDSITRVVRPGWARNTNDRWLVVINTDNYHQYVTEVVCQYGSNSRCNFIPPCYYSSCQQRYNTQKLLVIDPTNPYRGPFLSEFLFPSCCVCYVPTTSDSLNDRYRASPASIYQRTMQQESSINMNPMQHPMRLANSGPMSGSGGVGGTGASSSGSGQEPESSGSAFSDQPASISNSQQSSASKPTTSLIPSLQPLGPGEIRRSGDLY